MAADGPSELPQQYGSKTAEGELIKRPSSPMILTSPIRSYHPSNPRPYSPERTPVDSHYPEDNPRSSGGLRRRPSANAVPGLRRHSSVEYDSRERPSSDSRRALRSRDDTYYWDEDRSYPRRDDYHRHPDSYERSRPPRTYRNVEGWERGPPSASKPYYEKSKGDYYRDRDLERGPDAWERKPSDDDSVDGYNYDQAKNPNRATIEFKNMTPEERAEVMRLPWTQWMNSSVKNRKSTASFRERS